MGGDPKQQAAKDRAERLAEALRQNLHRRKSQARQRKAEDSSLENEDRDADEQ